VLGGEERLGDSLGLSLGFPDGEELGAFDFEGAPEGMDDDKLGSTRTFECWICAAVLDSSYAPWLMFSQMLMRR
jgi:hypothetical protein